MATFTAHAGFDLDRIGSISFNITESAGGGATAVNLSTGTYAHIDLSGVMGSGEYTDLASALKSAIEAVSPNTLTYTVAFSETTLKYTFTPSSGNLTLSSLNGNAQTVLGFTSSSKGPSSAITSDIGAYYSVIASPSGLARGRKDRQHEPDDIAEDAEAGSTSWYGIVDADVPQYRDFALKNVEADRVRTEDVDNVSFRWAFEDMWKHVRNVEPFAVKDDVAEQVHALRKNGAHWSPDPWIEGHHDRWNLMFRTRVLGDL